MVLDIPTLRQLQIHYVGCTAPTPTKFVGVAIKLYYPELRLTPNALPNEIVAKPKFEENYNADGGFLLAKFGKIGHFLLALFSKTVLQFLTTLSTGQLHIKYSQKQQTEYPLDL